MVFKLNRINKNFISAIFQDKPETLNSIQIVSHNFQSVLIHRFSIQLINLIFMNRTEPFFILRFPIIKNLSEVFLLIFLTFFTFRLLKPYFLNLCFPFCVNRIKHDHIFVIGRLQIFCHTIRMILFDQLEIFPFYFILIAIILYETD